MIVSNVKKLAAVLTAAAVAAGMTACRTDYTKDGGYITTADPSLFETVAETAVIPETETVTVPDDSGLKALFDREGNIIQVPERIDRIISSAPHITEILVGLGAADRVVAADRYSYDVEGIDKSLCSVNTKNLNADEILALSPDLIISDTLPTGGADDPYAELREAGVNVICVPPSSSISGIKLDIEFIAAYLGLEDRGRALIIDIDEAVRVVSDKAAQYNYSKSVYFETKAAPDMCSCGKDTLIDELISIAGGRNIYSGESGRLINSEESVIAADPDVIITSVSYDGYDFNEISAREGWENIKAVRNGEIYQTDPNAVNRPSQNIVKGIYQVAAAVYPELYAENGDAI